jgi:hypothetical protein
MCGTIGCISSGLVKGIEKLVMNRQQQQQDNTHSD